MTRSMLDESCCCLSLEPPIIVVHQHNSAQLYCCAGPVPVRFALLLPMSGSWLGGPLVAGAAAVAVQRVNADKKLLPGRVFEYSWADSGCSAKQGLKAMGEMLVGESFNEAHIHVVIGPACSVTCEATSSLSGAANIPQISWGCLSPTLSNKDEYDLVLEHVAALPTLCCCFQVAVHIGCVGRVELSRVELS